MRPDARVWRKNQRTAEKGVPTGRRTTHRVKTQKPKTAWVPYWLRPRDEVELRDLSNGDQ